VSVTVRPVNDAPAAQDSSVSVDEDASVTFTVPAGDIDGDALAATAGPAAHGAATCHDLSCTYTPQADYFGADEFQVTVSDGHGGTDTAKVSVTVRPVNDPPRAQSVNATTTEDTPVEIALLGSDIDDEVLTYAAGTPSHGTVTCDGALCTYTPAADFFGSDSFTYTVTDAAGASDSAVVRISVEEVRFSTTLAAGPVVRVSSLPLQVNVTYKARLTRNDTGNPVANKPVHFIVGGQHACTIKTRADGWAICGWSISRTLSVLLDNGYDAVFDGDPDHAPSSDHGTIVG
jgi:hypothetical protein